MKLPRPSIDPKEVNCSNWTVVSRKIENQKSRRRKKNRRTGRQKDRRTERNKDRKTEG